MDHKDLPELTYTLLNKLYTSEEKSLDQSGGLLEMRHIHLTKLLSNALDTLHRRGELASEKSKRLLKLFKQLLVHAGLKSSGYLEL